MLTGEWASDRECPRYVGWRSEPRPAELDLGALPVMHTRGDELMAKRASLAAQNEHAKVERDTPATCNGELKVAAATFDVELGVVAPPGSLLKSRVVAVGKDWANTAETRTPQTLKADVQSLSTGRRAYSRLLVANVRELRSFSMQN